MTKEQLIALGVTAENADKILAMSTEEQTKAVEAAKVEIAKENDVKLAAKKEAYKQLREELGITDPQTDGRNLPDGKILKQNFATVHGVGIYDKANTAISGERTFVEAGQGVDVIVNDIALMGYFNKQNKGGGNLENFPNAIQRADANTSVDTLKLDAPYQNASNGYKQIEVTDQQILYIQEFLASNPGKFAELITNTVAVNDILKRYDFILKIKELTRLYTAIKGLPTYDLVDGSGNIKTTMPTSKNIVANGTTGSDNFVEAIANIGYITDIMQNDNETFAIGNLGSTNTALTEGTMTNCEDETKINIFCNPYDKRYLTALLRNAAIREQNIGNVEASDSLKNIIERLKTLPLQVKNPMRDIIKVDFSGTTAYFQIDLIKDPTRPNVNQFTFTQLSSIKPITVMTTPTYTNVKFGMFGSLGENIIADEVGGATGVEGIFTYAKAYYNTNFIPRYSIVMVYQNNTDKNDGISTLYSVDVRSEQEWLKNLAKDHYITVNPCVRSANTTRMAVYTDPGFGKLASILTTATNP